MTDDEFQELREPLDSFEGGPSLDSSMWDTFPDSFSDMNSEDMRMPVPEWMNRLEMEENFQYPRP